MIFRVYSSYLALIFFRFFFKVFHSAVLLSTRNRSNDTTESERKKDLFNAHIGGK